MRRKKPRPGPRKPTPPKVRYRPSLILKLRVLSYHVIEFFPHATDRMKQRGILRDEVVEAINNPTSSGHPTQKGRTRVRKAFPASGKVIDVVYDELPDRVRVITTFRR